MRPATTYKKIFGTLREAGILVGEVTLRLNPFTEKASTVKGKRGRKIKGDPKLDLDKMVGEILKDKDLIGLESRMTAGQLMQQLLNCGYLVLENLRTPAMLQVFKRGDVAVDGLQFRC